MTPGKDLDALIAEKVMGLKRNSEGHWIDGEVVKYYSDDTQNSYDEPDFYLPHYSTDISAAWEVAQKITDLHDDHKFEIHLSPTGYEECTVFVRYWDYSNPNDPVTRDQFITAHTAPHAICLAALKTLPTESPK